MVCEKVFKVRYFRERPVSEEKRGDDSNGEKTQSHLDLHSKNLKKMLTLTKKLFA